MKEFLENLDLFSDPEKLKDFARDPEKLRDYVEDEIISQTFYDVLSNLNINTTMFYFDGGYEAASELSLKEFERAQKKCDQFLEGKKYMKYWIIFKTFEKIGVTEDEFNKIFPAFIKPIQEIRNRFWEDIAWSFFLNETSEENFGEYSCTKDKFEKIEENFSIRYKENFINEMSKENVNYFRLLNDLSDVSNNYQNSNQTIIQTIEEKVFRFKSSKKPKSIKSITKWKLIDAIKLGKKVNILSPDKIISFDGFHLENNELIKKQAKLRQNFLKNTIDNERVEDFLRFEMHDENPINTAIKNEDIERIIFYSMIQMPKISSWLRIEKLKSDESNLRTIYFAVMRIHMSIILNVLESLKFFNSKESIIQTWILNQIVDPLDQGKAADHHFIKATKDKRFMSEIWMPLAECIAEPLIYPRESELELERLIYCSGLVMIETLDKYFSDDPESAFALTRPVFEAMKERENN